MYNFLCTENLKYTRYFMERQTVSSRQREDSFPFCLVCFEPSESALMMAVGLNEHSSSTTLRT